MKFYTLFYFSSGDSSVNLGAATDNERFSIYVRNALLLEKSLDKKSSLTVVTNDTARYSEIVRSVVGVVSNIKVEQINFNLDVPHGIGFYSAHFKIDALRYLSQLDDEHFPCALVDSDVVLVGDDFQSFVNNCGRSFVGVYDISDQVFPAYGKERVQIDICKIMGYDKKINTRWYGGELICFGSSEGAKRIIDCIDGLWERYVNQWADLHHQGDEVVVSAAINELKCEENNFKIVDMGSKGFIRRYWSGRTLHKQPSVFGLHKFGGILHVPQDKKILSAFLRLAVLINPPKACYKFLYMFFVAAKRLVIKIAK